MQHANDKKTTMIPVASMLYIVIVLLLQIASPPRFRLKKKFLDVF